jgi:hypothetical protein
LVGDAPSPIFARLSHPADRVAGPQERLAVAGPVIVRGPQVMIDAGERLRDAHAVPGPLGRVLIVWVTMTVSTISRSNRGTIV